MRAVDDDWNIPEAEDPEQWCAWCGNLLVETSKRYRRFCSRKCKDDLRLATGRAERIERRSGMICRECGSSFNAGRSDKLYCSKKCGDIASGRRRYGVRQCRHCGSDFVPTQAHVQCCSISCGRKSAGR